MGMNTSTVCLAKTKHDLRARLLRPFCSAKSNRYSVECEYFVVKCIYYRVEISVGHG